MNWTVVNLIINLVLFIGTSVEGVLAVVHHTNAGWLSGFVWCSSGTYLFGVRQRYGLLEEVFGSPDRANEPSRRTETVEESANISDRGGRPSESWHQ